MITGSPTPRGAPEKSGTVVGGCHSEPPSGGEESAVAISTARFFAALRMTNATALPQILGAPGNRLRVTAIRLWHGRLGRLWVAPQTFRPSRASGSNDHGRTSHPRPEIRLCWVHRVRRAGNLQLAFCQGRVVACSARAADQMSAVEAQPQP